MQGPNEVRLKRKRNEPAPDTLIVEPHNKRTFTEEARQLQYVRQEVKVDRDAAVKDAFSKERLERRGSSPAPGPSNRNSRPRSKAGRRTFHLTHSRTSSDGVKKHRRSKDSGVATFVERSVPLKTAAAHNKAANSSNSLQSRSPSELQPLKRPGRSSALPKAGPPAVAPHTAIGAQQPKNLEGLADELHRFALDEVAAAQKLKVIATPKLSAARSRALHLQRTAKREPLRQEGQDAEMSVAEDADYVYETYILAPRLDGGNAEMPLDDMTGDVGYLVITEEDQALWEAYMEEEASDRDWDTDDEDENAEDYYAADYPEDELASDDEFDRNAYGYRRHGDSDNEEWDEDTGAYSEDERDSLNNPLKARTPKQFGHYFDSDSGGTWK